jgi:hypothetical protein
MGVAVQQAGAVVGDGGDDRSWAGRDLGDERGHVGRHDLGKQVLSSRDLLGLGAAVRVFAADGLRPPQRPSRLGLDGGRPGSRSLRAWISIR